MAIAWILATFAGMVGFAWFAVVTMLALIHIRESKVPAIFSAVMMVLCFAFIIHASNKVEAEYEKVMESIDHLN